MTEVKSSSNEFHDWCSQLSINPQDAVFINVEPQQIITHKTVITIKAPQNLQDTFHPAVIEQLEHFNSLDEELKSAILKCAARVQASLPELISKELTKEPPPLNSPECIRFASWWEGGIERKSAVEKFGRSLIRKMANKPPGFERTASGQRVRRQAKAMGLVIDWSRAMASERSPLPQKNLWAEDSVVDSTFCLVDRTTNLPLLHKSYRYPSVRIGDFGSFWILSSQHRQFNNDETANGVLGRGTGHPIHSSPSIVNITRERFRQPHLLEIVALLSTVKGVEGLPSQFLP